MGWGSRRTLQERDRAPRVSFKTPEGESIPLAGALEQGPLVLAFYKVSCPVCQLALPHLQRLAGGPLRLFAVCQDGAAEARAFNREYSLDLPVWLDTSSERYAASNAFGITQVPSMFLIESDGSVSWASEGFVKRELEQLAERAGRPIFTDADVVPAMKPG
jgi:peroxiredoxin